MYILSYGFIINSNTGILSVSMLTTLIGKQIQTLRMYSSQVQLSFNSRCEI